MNAKDNFVVILFLVIVVCCIGNCASKCSRTPTYGGYPLVLDFKNYIVLEKKTVQDTMYYLRLKNPIDSTSKWIKVKDHAYFTLFPTDTIGKVLAK